MNTNRDLILARLGNSSSPVSGDDLAHELGVSRAGIWKHIQSLRDQGVKIESLAGRGYLLKSDIISPAMLTHRINAKQRTIKRIGSRIMVLDEIDSTNREAMRQVEMGAKEGLVIIANHQTEGRGRLGRSWFTAGEDALAISILLRPDMAPEHVPQLSLLTAVALHRALVKHVPDIRIKWPNDLLVDGAKLAGILTEMRAEPGQVHAVVLGIGLNIRKPQEGWPKEITQRVTDLTTASGEAVSRLHIAAELIEALDACYDTYLARGFPQIREWWWEAHAASGRMVRAHGHSGYVEGIAEALDEDGALLMRVDGELQRFVAGDIEFIGELINNPDMESST